MGDHTCVDTMSLPIRKQIIITIVSTMVYFGGIIRLIVKSDIIMFHDSILKSLSCILSLCVGLLEKWDQYVIDVPRVASSCSTPAIRRPLAPARHPATGVPEKPRVSRFT